MVSVLTLTYGRHALLEEAIESYLRQDFSGKSEMLIVNDSPKVEYVFRHPNVRIINFKKRFPSIGEKLKFGFSHCEYDHIYRLDDDDLLAPWALRHTWEDIISHPDFEIYRSNGHYYFEHNTFKKIYSSINNGNVFSKQYLSRIEIPDVSYGEDNAMTFQNNAKIYISPRTQKTMIYRWGMNTFHISGMGNVGNNAIMKWTDRIVRSGAREKREEGVLVLQPHFRQEYYRQII